MEIDSFGAFGLGAVVVALTELTVHLTSIEPLFVRNLGCMVILILILVLNIISSLYEIKISGWGIAMLVIITIFYFIGSNSEDIVVNDDNY
jgi:hypothetical protein